MAIHQCLRYPVRAWIRGAFCWLSLGLVGAVIAAQTANPEITLVELTTGLDSSTIGLAHANDGSGRLFTVAQSGLVQIWDGDELLSTPFMDITGITDPDGEQGLLGLAFHPDYETNRYVYVNYINDDGDTVVARYRASATNPNVIDTGVDPVQILEIGQPATNHNGGDMHFGADGYLYIASGDGGANWCVAQDTSSLLGKILRIDVDGDDFPLDSARNYAIPEGNPFSDTVGAAPEIWVLGLRNPWRFSFDRATGDLWIGDVGEGTWEEFDHLPAGSQSEANLGWPWFEGTDAFTTCGTPSGTFSTCDDAPFTCPRFSLNQTRGACSAIGGVRYRGGLHPSLNGLYFFTDWCEGSLHAGAQLGGAWFLFHDLFDLGGFGPTDIGEDDDGEIYVVNRSALYRISGTFGFIFGDGFESGATDAWSVP